MSQEALAGLVDSSQQAICRYENETTVPPADLIVEIANYFDVSTDYVLCNSDSMLNIDMQMQAKHDFEELYREFSLFKALNERDKETIRIVMERLKENYREVETGKTKE